MFVPFAIATAVLAALSDEDGPRPTDAKLWRLFLPDQPKEAMDLALAAGDLAGGFEILTTVYQASWEQKERWYRLHGGTWDGAVKLGEALATRFNAELKKRWEGTNERHFVFWTEHALVWSRDALTGLVDEDGHPTWERKPLHSIPAEGYEEVEPLTTLYIIEFSDGAFGEVSEEEDLEHSDGDDDWKRFRYEVPFALAEAYLHGHPLVGDTYSEWQEFAPYEAVLEYTSEPDLHIVAGDEQDGIAVCRRHPIFLDRGQRLDATMRHRRVFVEDGWAWKLASEEDWRESPESFWVRERVQEEEEEEEDGD